MRKIFVFFKVVTLICCLIFVYVGVRGIPYAEAESENVINVYSANEIKSIDVNYSNLLRIENSNVADSLYQLEVPKKNLKKILNSFYNKENPGYSFTIRQKYGSLSDAYAHGSHGTISIPEIGVKANIIRTSDDIQGVVDRGNALMYYWAGIFGTNNSAPILAAHNNTGKFGKLSKIKPGMKIYIDTPYGQFIYEYTHSVLATDTGGTIGNFIFDDGRTLEACGAGECSGLVLQTCYPFNVWKTNRRWMGFAKFVEGTILQ